MESRRYVLLHVTLALVATIGLIFSILNYFRGLFFIATVEAVVFICCIIILLFVYLLPKYFSLACKLLVIMAFTFGVVASGTKEAHPTIFIWTGLGPLIAFFLLGARLGFIFSAFTVPLCIILFINSHPNLPPVAYLNVIIFIFWVVALSMYYEITRANTEDALMRDIEERHKKEEELRIINQNLQEALDHIKTLHGLLPICSSCKNIRNDKGYWEQIESYISDRSEAEFSHSICPDCAKKLYPELYKKKSD
jgi:hypothetical protein